MATQPTRRTILAATTAILALAGSRPARAHHGWAGYEEAYIELSGTISAMGLGYPHGEFVLEVDGAAWDIVMGPPNRNRRAGIDETTFAIGDVVTAIGHRHRDPAVLEIKAERIVKDGRTFDPYPERLRRSGIT
jgi:hypothetical protein